MVNSASHSTLNRECGEHSPDSPFSPVLIWCAQMKVCATCAAIKPIAEFWRNRCKPDGRQESCCACRSIYLRDYYKAHRKTMRAQTVAAAKKRRRVYRERVYRYLLQHPCVDCGEGDPVVLDFDHVRGAKLANVAELLPWAGWRKIESEISKCSVRCSNCHRRATARRACHYKWRRSRDPFGSVT